MKISQLPELQSTPTNADVFAIEVNGITFKVSKSALASAILSQIGAAELEATPSILTNLASSSVANVMQANPRPGVTGVLPFSNGGTNANSAENARANLDVYSKSESDTKYSRAISIGSYTSWSDIYARLNVLPNERIVPCIINSNSISTITNGQFASNMLGFVAWIGGNTITFVGTTLGGNYIYAFRLTNVTSESYTLGTIYQYNGTVVS